MNTNSNNINKQLVFNKMKCLRLQTVLVTLFELFNSNVFICNFFLTRIALFITVKCLLNVYMYVTFLHSELKLFISDIYVCHFGSTFRATVLHYNNVKYDLLNHCWLQIRLIPDPEVHLFNNISFSTQACNVPLVLL